jgi:plastocyanin
MTLYSGWILHVMAFLSILNASIAAQPPKIHSVNVGSGGSFMYEPDTTFADVGDLVVFSFYPSNHSVVRGEYTGSTACGNGGCNPCVPFELIHLDQQGFASDNVLTQTLPNNGNVGIL